METLQSTVMVAEIDDGSHRVTTTQIIVNDMCLARWFSELLCSSRTLPTRFTVYRTNNPTAMYNVPLARALVKSFGYPCNLQERDVIEGRTGKVTHAR